MSPSLLSPEELDALREGLLDSSAAAAEDVDLVGSERKFRRRIPAIEQRLEIFALNAKNMIARELQATCTSNTVPLEVIGPQDTLAQMRDMAFVAQIQHAVVGTVGLLGIDPTLGFLVVEQAFGGPSLAKSEANSWAPPKRKRLTEVERQAVQPFTQKIIEELGRSLVSTGDLELWVRPPVAGRLPEIPSQVDASLIWRLKLEFGTLACEVALALFPSQLDLIVQIDGSLAEPPKPDWLTQHMGRAPVLLSAILGQADISVADLLGLRPGDVLRLDRGDDELLPVMLEGNLKYLGEPVQRHGAFGVEIKVEVR